MQLASYNYIIIIHRVNDIDFNFDSSNRTQLEYCDTLANTESL